MNNPEMTVKWKNGGDIKIKEMVLKGLRQKEMDIKKKLLYQSRIWSEAKTKEELEESDQIMDDLNEELAYVALQIASLERRLKKADGNVRVKTGHN